jgi:hypothetical protein
LRQLAKEKFATLMEGALEKYIRTHEVELPTGPSQLQAYCDSPVDAAIFSTCKLLYSGKMSELPPPNCVMSDITDAVFMVSRFNWRNTMPE